MKISSVARGSVGGYIALGCVGFIASAPVMAQDDTAPSLGGVTVTGTVIEEESVKADEAESPKYTAPLLDTPQTITVITSRSFQQQNLLTLREVLQTVPGITFGAGEGGFGYGDRVILNGVDAKNDITVDGVRSSAVLNRNETYNIEQIEVTKGANSVYAGGGSVAGTINLVTKRPLADDQYYVHAGVGTDEYYRGTVDLNHRLSDMVAVRLNGVFHRNDVPGRDVEFYERWGVAPSLTIAIEGPTSLTIQYEHLDDKGMPQYGIRYFPQSPADKVAGGILTEFDFGGYYGFRNVDTQEAVTDAFQAIFAHEFSDGLSLRNLTRYENIDQYTVTSQPNGDFCLSTGVQPTGAACLATTPPGYFMPNRGNGRGNTRNIRNQVAYNQLDLNAQFDTGGIAHNLVVGASALWEKFNQRNGNILRAADGSIPNATSYPLVNIGNPEEVIQGPPGFVYGNNEYTGPINYIQASQTFGERDVYALYLFDTMSIGDMFEINGGVRWESVEGENYTQSYSISGPTLGQPTTRTAPIGARNDLFSYRVGGVFKPTPDISVYVATGVSKNPSTALVDTACAANSCNVRPETTRNYEAGVKADLFDRSLLVSAAVFRNDRDSIRIASGDPTEPDLRTDGFQRVQGITLGASGNIAETWTISANYSYLDSEIVQGVSDFCLANPGTGTCTNTVADPDPTAGNELANTPRHSGSLFTSYRFPFGLELGYGFTYQGSFYLGSAGGVDYRVPSYMIHRAMASYAITENIMAQVNVQNFTDEKYVTTVRNSIGSSWANPAPGRSAVFSLNFTY